MSLPAQLLDDQMELPITQEHISHLPGSVVLLRNVLSPRECERVRKYVLTRDQDPFPDTNFTRRYRNCERLIAHGSEEFGDKLWKRIAPFLADPLVIDGSDTSLELAKGYPWRGVWEPCGLNESMRICRYPSGGHFAPHFDSCFLRNKSEKSWKTVNMYLSSAPSRTGATNFLDPEICDKMHKEDGADRFSAPAEAILHSVYPEEGMILLFNSYLLHEGGACEGEKWLLRSDVMYKQVEQFDEECSDADREAMELVHKAQALEQDAFGFPEDSDERRAKCMEAIGVYKQVRKKSETVARQYGLL